MPALPQKATSATPSDGSPDPGRVLLERARFLAEASRLLSQSLDYEVTLATVAQLAMPELGAWGIVDVVEDDGSIRRLAVVHPDPAKQALLQDFAIDYPPELTDLLGAPAVVRARRPVLVATVTDEAMRAAARDPRHLELLRALGIASYMAVPMQARGRLVGCITFVSADQGRRYDATDLVLAEDVAARGAMAIDNARLYREAERARAAAERAQASAERAQMDAEVARGIADGERDAATAATAATEVAREEAVAFGVRAHASERTKSELLATMSHELRTPLNAVLGYADLLSAGVAGPLTAMQEGYLDRQRTATRHLLGLVNDVLDVAKADVDRLPVAHDVVGARGTIRSVLPLVKPQADARAVRLTVDWGRTHGEPAGAEYVGDARRVEQILVNLVTNAIKFTPQGGQAAISLLRHVGARPGSVPEVAPEAVEHTPDPPGPRTAPEWLGIRVADSGIGIAPADQERVFEPFVQLAGGPTRPAGGTGLGLTISRRLARLMGGDVTLESGATRGSVFTLWLPAPTAAAPMAAVRPRHRLPRTSGPDRRGEERYARGLRVIGDTLLDAVDDIVLRYSERVRIDPAIPAARSAPWSEIGNHTATLLADIAQAPAVIEEAAGDGTPLMRIGDEIRRVVAELHARRRAQLGWTREALERDFALLFEEVEATVRRCAPAEAAGALEPALTIIRKLLDVAREIGREAFDRELAERGDVVAVRSA